MEILLLIVVIWLLLFTIGTAAIASNKGRSGLGWLFLGLLFGPIAFLIVVALPRDEHAAARAGLQSGKLRSCPFCAEPIRREAVRCRFCGSSVPPPPRRDIWGREVVASDE